MNVLLIGANGFLGTHLLRAFRLICRVTQSDATNTHPTSTHAELYFKDAMLAAGQFTTALLRLIDASPDLRGIYASEDPTR